MKATIITGTEKEVAALIRAVGSELGEQSKLHPSERWGVIHHFVPLTENKTQAARLAKLLDKKGITREDLILILTTIGLDPEALGIKEVSHAAHQNQQDQPV